MLTYKKVSIFLLALGTALIFFAIGGCSDALAFGRPRQRDPETLIDNRVPVPIATVKQYQYKASSEFSGAERADLSEAEALLNRVVRSSCFRAQVLARDMVQKKGYSNDGILRVINGNAPTLNVEKYREDPLVVAYFDSGDNTIYVNRRSYMVHSRCSQAATLLHETMHYYGFEHDEEETNRREYSVPYQIGEAVLECCGL